MIVIKGMGMPKKCSQCSFCINQKPNDYSPFGECSLQNRKTVNCWGKDSNCPLVEIVTCGECDHCDKKMVEGIESLWCKREYCATDEDYYCGCGERKE